MEALPAALIGAMKLSVKLILIIVPLVTVFEVLRHLPSSEAGNLSSRIRECSPEPAVPCTRIFLGSPTGGITSRPAKGLPRGAVPMAFPRHLHRIETPHLRVIGGTASSSSRAASPGGPATAQGPALEDA
jgi:hypothetical protein